MKAPPAFTLPRRFLRRVPSTSLKRQTLQHSGRLDCSARCHRAARTKHSNLPENGESFNKDDVAATVVGRGVRRRTTRQKGTRTGKDYLVLRISGRKSGT